MPSLRLALPKQELQVHLKIALAQYDLDRAALQLSGQSDDGADWLPDIQSQLATALDKD